MTTDREIMKQMAEALREADALIVSAQDIMRSNICPHGVSNKDAIRDYINLLDNTRQRKVQNATCEALTAYEQHIAANPDLREYEVKRVAMAIEKSLGLSGEFAGDELMEAAQAAIAAMQPREVTMYDVAALLDKAYFSWNVKDGITLFQKQAKALAAAGMLKVRE